MSTHLFFKLIWGLAFDLLLNLAFNSIQGCSHGSTGGGIEEIWPIGRAKTECCVWLPSSCRSGTHPAHHCAPTGTLFTGSTPAHVQCVNQRGFPPCRCLLIGYLLLLTLVTTIVATQGGREVMHARTWRSHAIKWSRIIPALKDSLEPSLGSDTSDGVERNRLAYWKISIP